MPRLPGQSIQSQSLLRYPEALNNGKVKRKYKTVFDLAERFRRAADNRLNAVFLARAFFPWLQADESDTGVLPCPAKLKTVYGKDRFNVRFLFVR